MSINATRSESNPDRMNGYLEGYAAGIKCSKEIVKMKACREFSKIIAEICPELLGYGAMAAEWENEFRKRLEK
jgi:hypothetical protein